MTNQRTPRPPHELCGYRFAATRCGVSEGTIRYAVEVTGELDKYILADGRPVVWLRDLDRWNKKRGK